MRLLLSLLGLAGLLAAAPPAAAVDVDIDVHLGSPPEEKVVHVYREHYGFPRDEVLVIERARPAEAAVLLEIARSARVAPVEVLRLREDGLSLIAIVRRYRLSPAIFFVPLPEARVARAGPPYGKAWGYWRKHGDRWPDAVLLDDDDLIAVNHVKLHSAYFGLEPDLVLERLERAKDRRALLLADLDERRLKGKGEAKERGEGADGKGHGAGAREEGGGQEKGHAAGADKGQGKGKDKGKGKGKGK